MLENVIEYADYGDLFLDVYFNNTSLQKCLFRVLR